MLLDLRLALRFALLASALASAVVTPRSELLEALSLSSTLTVPIGRQPPEIDGRSSLDVRAPVPAPSPVPVKITNAARMMAGLPPLPPRRRGTRTLHAARAGASPGVPVRGYIAARAAGSSSTSNILGYVKRAFNQYGETTLTLPSAPLTDALEVAVPAASDRSSGAPFNLAMVDPVNPNYPLLGLITDGDSQDWDINPNSGSWVTFGGVTSSDPALHAVELDNSMSHALNNYHNTESAVWYYNDGTGRLTPKWSNYDGSSYDAFYGYNIYMDALSLTTLKSGLEMFWGGSYIQWVDLYFVKLSDVTSPDA